MKDFTVQNAAFVSKFLANPSDYVVVKKINVIEDITPVGWDMWTIPDNALTGHYDMVVHKDALPSDEFRVLDADWDSSKWCPVPVLIEYLYDESDLIADGEHYLVTMNSLCHAAYWMNNEFTKVPYVKTVSYLITCMMGSLTKVAYDVYKENVPMLVANPDYNEYVTHPATRYIKDAAFVDALLVDVEDFI